MEKRVAYTKKPEDRRGKRIRGAIAQTGLNDEGKKKIKGGGMKRGPRGVYRVRGARRWLRKKYGTGDRQRSGENDKKNPKTGESAGKNQTGWRATSR